MKAGMSSTARTVTRQAAVVSYAQRVKCLMGWLIVLSGMAILVDSLCASGLVA
ncbi:hypothetical protein [Burkholderia anthina]|uniref:hypothetical protein n=1 Tax=Burkholderia anthina TaxID=179879 RepID=UPI001AA01973|nr:hypothetical protein [Burkholderia anthina]QTD95311.1 hypothetical protein J4G50_38295 [Burkholderia anthina]